MKNSKRAIQRQQDPSVQSASAGPDGIALSRNQTGLPDKLKTGIESLSGMSLNDVRVHYNSSKPAELQALAYAQGQDIHVGPGQERHLPHEAWHIVQQAQGRVKPTMQMNNGVSVNDSQGLEHEADRMGAKALTTPTQMVPFSMLTHETSDHGTACSCASCGTSPTQMKTSSKQKGQAMQLLRGEHQSGCNCSSCNSATSSETVQRKEASSSAPIQMIKACKVCGHKHGSNNCTVQVRDPQTGGTKACGCKSHSSKWDSGSKFNPGSGRRGRRRAALTGQ